MNRFLLSIGLFPLFLFGQTEKNPCETLSRINTLIQENHYKPKPVDDSLSVYVFKKLLSRLDEENRLFTEPEIKILEKHKLKIDDYIAAKDCSFLDDFYAAYSKTVTRYKTLLETIKNEPFPLSSTEKVQFSREAFPYVKDEKELKHLYKKRMLFNILRDVAELSTNKDSLTAHFETLAAESKAKAFDRSECKIQSYELSRTEFNAIFFSVFCSYFDPHTEYFSESEKSSFYSTVSSDNLTFGLYVSMTEKDEMTVDDIIPGSSAYFTEKIDKGDQLLKVKHKNDEYEIACSSMKKIDEIITSDEYRTADFTFRKKSGEIYSVQLKKMILKDYQNNVFSFKLKTANATIGYIRIPSFYSTFENGKSSASNDVAKEVFKLQEDHIDGIIIDVENNGGGSMEEAIKLSGLFIDAGPLAIMNDNINKKEILRDMNRGTIYDGPMVVMINGFSASASEFFANAMQDYNRAILVGNRSLGKASMQRIFPLSSKNDEFLKLTLEKFYRITGKSNQYIGTIPDIEIPLLFEKQMPKEDSNETALRNDEISVIVKYNRLNNVIKDEVIAMSKKRIELSSEANDIKALNDKINPLYDNDLPPVQLQFNMVFDDVNKMNKLWAAIKAASEKEHAIIVEQNSVDLENERFDDYLKSFNTERVKDIRQNYHILEAANVLSDVKKLTP
ncbi:S41 family peptidase [Flavobacterium terrisoli]|uniref:S41 family peptidase n=1 Tax=Flavobacterium terrisoli TaxID=3242195 RepID=UPI0025426D69|nr:S41 family peptidase [Flavobacterium buctense]